MTDDKPTLKRDCPVCGKPQVGELMAGRGSEAFWHEDGSGDNCTPDDPTTPQASAGAVEAAKALCTDDPPLHSFADTVEIIQRLAVAPAVAEAKERIDRLTENITYKRESLDRHEIKVGQLRARLATAEAARDKLREEHTRALDKITDLVSRPAAAAPPKTREEPDMPNDKPDTPSAGAVALAEQLDDWYSNPCPACCLDVPSGCDHTESCATKPTRVQFVAEQIQRLAVEPAVAANQKEADEYLVLAVENHVTLRTRLATAEQEAEDAGNAEIVTRVELEDELATAEQNNDALRLEVHELTSACADLQGAKDDAEADITGTCGDCREPIRKACRCLEHVRICEEQQRADTAEAAREQAEGERDEALANLDPNNKRGGHCSQVVGILRRLFPAAWQGRETMPHAVDVACVTEIWISRERDEALERERGLRELLRYIEWASNWGQLSWCRCPKCRALRRDGHKPGCELRAALKEPADASD